MKFHEFSCLMQFRLFIFQVQIMKHNQQQNEDDSRICRQCNEPQTPSNPFKPNPNYDTNWDICTLCFNPQIQMIVDGLYLGNEDAALDQETVEKNQIRAMCVCGSFLMTGFEGRMMPGKLGDVKYIKYDIGDFGNQQIMHLFDINNQWIEERLKEGRNVLVHCAGGVSRSASFVIAYLIKSRQMSYNEAYNLVKQRRKCIKPNNGFIEQLEQYAKSILEIKP